MGVKGLKTSATDRAKRATAEQAAAVRRLVRENVAKVEAIEDDALRPLMRVLLEARKELQADLTRWMASVEDPTARFTAHQMRVMLRSIEGTLDALGIRLQAMLDGRPIATNADQALLGGLKAGSVEVGMLSVKNLEHEIGKLSKIFGGSLVGPQIDSAKVIANGDKLLWKRYPTSARRYAGKLGEDLRFQLSVGVARGETFEQLTHRLRRLLEGQTPVPVGKMWSTSGAITNDIPNALFTRFARDARRLVRTEMMRAYNVQHSLGIDELNAGVEKGEPRYERRSDAAADGRVCSFCRELDGKIIKGSDGPPWHPNCRCIEIAWRADWPEVRGDLSGWVKGSAERSRPAV